MCVRCEGGGGVRLRLARAKLCPTDAATNSAATFSPLVISPRSPRYPLACCAGSPRLAGRLWCRRT